MIINIIITIRIILNVIIKREPPLAAACDLACYYCQFARVVKGVDLRSTAGNCAWVRTPRGAVAYARSF